MKEEKPAFPTWVNDDAMQGGMSLRDYFAAAAMQGIYANPQHSFNNHYHDAREAYALADAMMVTRNVR